MGGYLYILRSEKTGRYYIGSTSDPIRRLEEHNNGLVKSTRSKGPWIRVALIEFSSPNIARKAEYYLKRQKRRSVAEQVINGDFVWPEFDS